MQWWVTVEIPLADFGAIDPSTVVGVMLYTNDHEVVTDEDVNRLTRVRRSPRVRSLRLSRSPRVRRFTSANSTSLQHTGRPGAAAGAAHAQADVVAVYSDNHYQRCKHGW